MPATRTESPKFPSLGMLGSDEGIGTVLHASGLARGLAGSDVTGLVDTRMRSTCTVYIVYTYLVLSDGNTVSWNKQAAELN